MPTLLQLPYRYPESGPFWVAPGGSDTTGDGSQGNPWATIQKARDYIRVNKLNTVLRADMTVNVRAGTYSLALSGPIQFTAADSGSNGHSVVYKSYDGPGAAVLSGGVSVSGWTSQGGGEFTAALPNACWTFYENGTRSQSARLPKRSPGASFPCSFAPYFGTQNDGGSNSTLQYLSTDFNPAAYAVTDLQVGIWPGGGWHWLTDTIPVSAVNTGTQVMTLSQQAKFLTWHAGGGGLSGAATSRYWIQGVKDNLSAPGEWYLDRSTNTIWYIARDGTITSQTIVAPAQSELVQFFGAGTTSRCSYVTLDGFAIQYTDFVPWYRSGYAVNAALQVIHPSPQPHAIDPDYDYFASVPQFRIGAIHLRHCDHVTLTNCHVNNVGMHGIYAEGYFQQNTISNSWIEKCGISGIRFDGQYPGEGDIHKNNTISNFRINNVGELAGAGSGIDLAQSGSNLVQYGYIHDGPRKAVWVFADSGVTDTSNIYAHDNVVDHVLVEKMCQDSGDTGAVACSSLSSRGAGPYVQNTFSQMIVRNIQAHPSMTDYPPNGLFFDDETFNQAATNVQVSSTQGIAMRYNAGTSGAPVLTNCSFLSDGSANPSFNPALMDTANIGTTAAFPYA